MLVLILIAAWLLTSVIVAVPAGKALKAPEMPGQEDGQ